MKNIQSREEVFAELRERVRGHVEAVAETNQFTNWKSIEDEFRTILQTRDQAWEERVEEVVVCAAVMASDGTIYRGHRHGHAMQACRDEGKKLHKGIEQQGFITSHNRYVLREEARRLQDAAHIPSADKDGYRGTTLFSEDLYQPDKDVLLQSLTPTSNTKEKYE